MHTVWMQNTSTALVSNAIVTLLYNSCDLSFFRVLKHLRHRVIKHLCIFTSNSFLGLVLMLQTKRRLSVSDFLVSPVKSTSPKNQDGSLNTGRRSRPQIRSALKVQSERNEDSDYNSLTKDERRFFMQVDAMREVCTLFVLSSCVLILAEHVKIAAV